jgi:hypothetical protein
MTPKISDVDKPEVGKLYLVPCVYSSWKKGARWWPVIGPWHQDKEIQFDAFHFHYDFRFFPQRNMMDRSGLGYDLTRVHFIPQSWDGKKDTTTQPEIVWRRRKMQREMPDFPLRLRSGELSNVCKTLEPIYKDAKLKCMTCPHRGMSLKGLPVKDGVVVCNGHGLRWNVATGEMVETK